ncbi:MAG: hypothetical protein JWM99_4792 [Verrucomicrobiales bacterium]|nr:hypothetical protein [Verrucomicrobiales bacterium]
MNPATVSSKSQAARSEPAPLSDFRCTGSIVDFASFLGMSDQKTAPPSQPVAVSKPTPPPVSPTALDEKSAESADIEETDETTACNKQDIRPKMGNILTDLVPPIFLLIPAAAPVAPTSEGDLSFSTPAEAQAETGGKAESLPAGVKYAVMTTGTGKEEPKTEKMEAARPPDAIAPPVSPLNKLVREMTPVKGVEVSTQSVPAAIEPQKFPLPKTEAVESAAQIPDLTGVRPSAALDTRSGDLRDRQPGKDDRRQPESNAGVTTGTAAAKDTVAMKMMGNEPETAGAAEQKMPQMRQPVNTVASVSSNPSLTGTTNLENFRIEQTVPQTNLNVTANASRIERLYQSFIPEIAMVKTMRPDSLSVVLRPDRETEIFVRVTMEDGRMHAYARCDRGDLEGLNAEWVSLQKSLATQGVQLGSLNSGSAESSDSRFKENLSDRQGQSQSKPESSPEPLPRAKSLNAQIKANLTPKKMTTNARQLLESWA